MEDKHPSRVAIIGGGSWATALVKLLLNNISSVNWYLRNPENIKFIKSNKHNPNYISSILFDTDQINFFSNIAEIIKESDILIFAVPSEYLKATLDDPLIDLRDRLIVSAIKGIIPEENLTIAEYFNRIRGISFDSIAIITGPCHAEEIALEKLSYLTIAAKKESRAETICNLLRCDYLRAIPTHDIYGLEYAAVLKNIFAIATGICHGLGYGDNFQAVLVSNALLEMKRFLDDTYKSKRKINTSAYLGDLMVTSYSQFSRNRTFGVMIGKGYSVISAQLEMNMVAEGFHSTRCIKEINSKHQVKMPILDAVYNILFEKIAPAIEIKLLTDKLK
jgi:glycerol-3-phosphate dehydrogenase (NAD(P)+)